jgi:hypothetical protein
MARGLWQAGSWLRMSVDTQVRTALAQTGVAHDVFTDTTGTVYWFDGRRHTLREAADALLEGGYTGSIGRRHPRLRDDRTAAAA